MRIAFVVAKLSYGGAESQLIRLSTGLVRRGHSVTVACYAGCSNRDKELVDNGVELRIGNDASRLGRIRSLSKWIAEFKPEVVHGVMKRASTLAVLARALGARVPIVANDLSTATYNRRSPALWLSLISFGLARCVVTQTELNARSLRLLAPWLRQKVQVIRNGVDTNYYRPVERRNGEGIFRFVAIGSVYRVKNPVRLVEAVSLANKKACRPFRVDWYGRLGLGGDGRPSKEYLEASGLLGSYGLDSVMRFHGERSPILTAYQEADCLIHPSLQEGFPNAVVEGMACGLPVLVGRISDLPSVIDSARNGILFDPRNSDSIADAILNILERTRVELLDMGNRSRSIAVRWFGVDRFLDEYEALYRDVISNA